ncbi:MAG: GNAT family N-acetyltransferase [Chloroflexota bacterium]|nr:GNAT family N-acetyltransferase [Chloroflexota bacterium]
MIRRLTTTDRTAALTLLAAAPQFNLYVMGNLETLGFDQPFCEFWGDEVVAADGTPRLRAVLNRYMSGWVVYGTPDTDWAGLGRVLDTHATGAIRLQDNPGGVASFLPYLQKYQSSQLIIEELMELSSENFRPAAPPGQVIIRRGTLADVAALTDLYHEAGEMRRTSATIVRPLQDTRLWLAEAAGTVLAAALTNAETGGMAMIGGVFTRPTARGRGLSQAICSALCAELLAVGKQPVLYWINPAAGTVYRKLGFRQIGSWRAVRLQAI